MRNTRKVKRNAACHARLHIELTRLRTINQQLVEGSHRQHDCGEHHRPILNFGQDILPVRQPFLTLTPRLHRAPLASFNSPQHFHRTNQHPHRPFVPAARSHIETYVWQNKTRPPAASRLEQRNPIRFQFREGLLTGKLSSCGRGVARKASNSQRRKRRICALAGSQWKLSISPR